MTRLDIGLVINIPNYESKWLEDNYQMRRTAVDYGVPLLTNMDLVKVFTEAIYQHWNVAQQDEQHIIWRSNKRQKIQWGTHTIFN